MLMKGLEKWGVDKMLLEIDEDLWINKDHIRQRINYLAKLGSNMLAWMWDSCQHPLCKEHPFDHPHQLTSMFHIDHEKLKNDSKQTVISIAKGEGILEAVKEVKEMECRMKCKNHHDLGEGKREFDVNVMKNICIVLSTPKTYKDYRSPENLLLNEDGKDRILSIKWIFFLLDIYSRDVSQTNNTTMQTMRAITAAYFPRCVVDNMVKYDASCYDNDDLYGRLKNVSDIIANIITYQSGHCADPTCRHGDTTNKAPLETNNTWDHDKKKSKDISSIIHPIIRLNEICSWTVGLCWVSDAKRTYKQCRGCARRCYNLGECNCKKVTGERRFPTKVSS